MIKIIIGKNGSGKTTYLKREWGNKSNSSYISGKVGTPGNSTLSKFTIREIMKMSRNKEYRNNVAEIMSVFKMLENLDKPMGVLSGGELKVAKLALSLGVHPLDAYIDEPERDLSETNTNRFIELINSLKEKINFTIVTHDEEIFKKIEKDETWLMEDFALEELADKNWGVIWEKK